MSPAMDAALAGRVVGIFGAIEIVLPNHTIRLLDTSGVIRFSDGRIFSGCDDTYGVIYKVEKLSDGTGDEAPALKLTFTPASDAAAADLASASMQNAQVTMWMGVFDPASGGVVGDPLVLFVGLLDTVTLKSGPKSRSLEIVISSYFEDFFLSNDGARLSDTWHQYVHPGETGMSMANGVTHQIYWGQDAPAGVTRSF